LVLLSGLVALPMAPASAHIVTEVPWNPLAASYLTMMFLGDLKPVPWGKIQTGFDHALPAAVGSKSGQESLLDLDPEGGKAAGESILNAIAAEDRDALYASVTRALSRALRRQIDLAAENLDDPGAAVRHVETAQALYRAFGGFIQQADPQAYRKLGRAWLTLTNSLGHAGVLGSGARAPDATQFDAGRQIIDDYFRVNFEPEQFSKREALTPLPETIVRAGQSVKFAPWLPPGSKLNDQDPLPRLVLNLEARGIDETDLPLVAYGDMLFDSPQIFGDPARAIGLSCSTCHNRSDINQSLFIPGLSHQAGAIDVDGEFFNSIFNDRRDDSLDIPSLRGLRFTGPYGRDGRFASLKDFTRNVIVNEFGGAEPTPFMLDALLAYMLEFDFLPNAKIDGGGRLTEAASEAALRGEKLFRKPFSQMDGKSCSSCHVPSANFLDRRAHNVGSGGDSYEGSRDGAFDTPTLLGTRFTAPYFHDGSLPTLASVVDWFDSRFELELSEPERGDLTAYLEAVGDADEPYEVYADRHTPFRLAFEELTTFASTLDTLLPARDAFHAKLLIDTVVADLAVDASGMVNLPAKPQVYELAAILANVGKAIDSDDWSEAERLWATFKARGEEYDAAMY
jgi:cytochrome c peroxidase